MANYFKWIFQLVHAEQKEGQLLNSNDNTNAGNKDSTGFPWYVIPVPPMLPAQRYYNPSGFHASETFDILQSDFKDCLHFSHKMEKAGHEGIYGFFRYLHLPDVELGYNIDIAAFLAGAICSLIVGTYYNDIYYPRKLLAWWPTRFYFRFLDEGIYLHRSIRWMIDFVFISVQVIYRAGFGGFTHTFSRMVYYWVRKLLFHRGTCMPPYVPLFDDTFAALFSGYIWTVYTMESEEHTSHDRIIAIGWCAVLTGVVEYFLSLYFAKDPPPGLFRWLFGGAFYESGGIWRYFQMGE